MDFELSEEQRLLKDSVERLTTQRYDFEARKKYMKESDGWSRAAWQQYVDLGLTALPFADTADFERLHSQHLTRLPNVARVHSSFALRTVQKSRELPVR